MESLTVEGVIRTGLGKKATKALRRDELIPCELYGGEENLHFAATQKQLKGLIYTPHFYKAELVVDGKTYNAIIKDIQFHPVTDEILHVDFQELIPGRIVQTEIPVKPVGVAAGIKTGGKLMLKVRKLKVKSTPEALTSPIVIDVTDMVLGSTTKVGDIEDTGMEILNAPSIPVASVAIPRIMKLASEEEEEDEEGEEGEEGAEGEESSEGGKEGGDTPAAE